MALLDKLHSINLDFLVVGLLGSITLIALGVPTLANAAPSPRAQARTLRWLSRLQVPTPQTSADPVDLDRLATSIIQMRGRLWLHIGIALGVATFGAAIILLLASGTLFSEDLSTAAPVGAILALGAYGGAVLSMVSYPFWGETAVDPAQGREHKPGWLTYCSLVVPSAIIAVSSLAATTGRTFGWLASFPATISNYPLTHMHPWLLFVVPVSLVLLAVCAITLALRLRSTPRFPPANLEISRAASKAWRTAGLGIVVFQGMWLLSLSIMQLSLLEFRSFPVLMLLDFGPVYLVMGGLLWSIAIQKRLNLK